jgi:hypothetical protein
VFVEINKGGLGVGSDLALDGAGGIGGLQRVAAAEASAALGATALVDAEFPPDGLCRQVGLELLVNVCILGEDATAMGTSLRQRCFERLGDGLGGWRRPMTMWTVVGASFASRFLRRWCRLSLGEGSGLAFAGAFLVLEMLFEIGDAFLRFVDLAIAVAATRA